MKNKLKHTVAGIGLISCLGGCVSMGGLASENNKDYLDVYVIADATINPDILGVPSPVRLHLLQLSSEIEFRQMSQINTEESPYSEFLGNSVLEETGIVVRPDQMLDFKLPLSADSSYLGVVSEFRDENIPWKSTFQRQKKTWRLAKRTNFIYLHITPDGVLQLSEPDALSMILTKKANEQKLDLDGLSEKDRVQAIKQIREQLKQPTPSDPLKGYFSQSQQNLDVQIALPVNQERDEVKIQSGNNE